MKDSLKVKGHLKIYKNNVLVREVDNLVVTTGLNFIASRLYDTDIPDQIGFMGIGTGTTAAAAGDTALETIVDSRNTLTSTTVTGAAIEYVATFAGSTYAGVLTEAGLFNAITSGTMLSRVVFSAINLGASDNLSIEWTLTFANA